MADPILEKLKEQTVFIEHRYSGKQGKWGWWVEADECILRFLDNDNFVPDEDTLETIKNFQSYWRIIAKLKRVYEKRKRV